MAAQICGTLRTMTAMATKIGRDGKHYPAVQPGGALPLAERAEVIRLTHLYRCVLGFQYRDIVTMLAEQDGIRRSIGSVYHDVQQFTCEACRDDVPAAAHVTEAASGAW
jgi:hypothetical protein